MNLNAYLNSDLKIINILQYQNKRILMEFKPEFEAKRTRCSVYTRVMGYLRPTDSFNTGKKGEHKERQYFDCDKAIQKSK